MSVTPGPSRERGQSSRRRVKIADLKDNLSKYVRAAEAGEEIEVLDRNRPIARIVPIPSPEPAVRLIPPERPFSQLRDRRYPPASWPVDSLTLLREERRERLSLEASRRPAARRPRAPATGKPRPRRRGSS